MSDDIEMVSLIKEAAEEDQFDIMSIEDMERIYRYGSRLSQERPFDEDLLEAVNKFEFEIKKHGGKTFVTPEVLQHAADNAEFAIVRKRSERSILWRFIFGILWLFSIIIIARVIISEIIGAVAGRQTAANYVNSYENIVLVLLIILTAVLSYYGLLPGTGKFTKE